MTAIYTTPRVAHLIASGRVTEHRAPARPVTHGRLPWMPGHSHAVIPFGRTTLCRVKVTRLAHGVLGDITPQQLHANGHQSRVSFARDWMRRWVADQDEAPADAAVLARFDRIEAPKTVWILEFHLDREHVPKLLHEDPAQGYTHLPHHAAQGEPEAVPGYVVERGADAARDRHAALQGLIEQQEVRQLTDLEDRLARARQRAEARGIDVGNEMRVIEQRIHRIEQRLARTA